MALCQGTRWRSLLAIFATGSLVTGPMGVLAQFSNATCLSSFDWMDNSKNQNPCLVAAYLQGACNGGQWSVYPLPLNSHYIGPTAVQNNQCQCSSVTYNALSACGICQGDSTIINWSVWYTNCTTIYPQTFPAGIPDGTAVPAWAYQNVTQSDSFNATLAQATGDSPESSASNSPTTAASTTSATPTATPTGLPSGSAATSSGTTSSGSSSKAGVIAGGVVGGVVGLGLIAAAAVFYVMRKNRSPIRESAQSVFTGAPTSPGPSGGFTDNGLYSPPMTQQRLYDPSDPSTFPPSPPPATLMSGSSNFIQNPALSSYSATSVRPGGYSGAPEV